jgi:lipid-binding SYLF domain-containing protein
MAGLCASSLVFAKTEVRERLKDATDVFNEIMSAPDKGIPQNLLNEAHCIVVVPGLKKGAFVIGGQYGKGFAICRKASGRGWGAPAAIRIEGGSVGFQIGGSEQDVVMVVMNQRGMDNLVKSKFTMGADVEVAAGPVGRTGSASTDARVRAEILAWSRSRGLFAGISLKGATLRQDHDNNEDLYGRKLEMREILTGDVAPPPEAASFLATLERASPRREGASADRTK